MNEATGEVVKGAGELATTGMEPRTASLEVRELSVRNGAVDAVRGAS